MGSYLNVLYYGSTQVTPPVAGYYLRSHALVSLSASSQLDISLAPQALSLFVRVASSAPSSRSTNW